MYGSNLQTRREAGDSLALASRVKAGDVRAAPFSRARTVRL